jgi:metallo-beta-lactamase family protein
MKITFCGGAETVTGSNFLIESQKGKMLVDCGIEQGRDFVVDDVYGKFPYDPGAIDAVVFTHAHLDHVGRAPKLVKDGFRGKAYMTPPTAALAELILRDSVNILAEEARRLHRDPLYEVADLEKFLSLIELLPYHTEKEVAPGLSVYLRNTGHILGSASVRIKGEDGTTIAFTGDIGNAPSPYLPDPEPIPDADVLFTESVYGDRVHQGRDNRVEILRDSLKSALQTGGTVLMPAFSMERTQLMLYELSNMFEAGELPKVPVFLDSPLAIAVTEVYKKFAEDYFKPAVQDELHREHDLFGFPFLTKTESREESAEIDKTPNPKIIMAGAGMSHGGRIGRHETKYLPDPKTTLFIVGYQAPGSPGRLLQEGSPKVRIDGHDVLVRAKVGTLFAWSAHADRDGLLEFASHALPRTKLFFVGLGEPSSARFLAQRIHDYLGVKAVVPVAGEKWEISKDSMQKI